MPIKWLLQVLEARITEWSAGTDFSVTDIDHLEHEEAGVLMSDVYSAGEDFPVVLVDGRLACMSGIDFEAVRLALTGE